MMASSSPKPILNKEKAMSTEPGQVRPAALFGRSRTHAALPEISRLRSVLQPSVSKRALLLPQDRAAM